MGSLVDWDLESILPLVVWGYRLLMRRCDLTTTFFYLMMVEVLLLASIG